MNSIIDCGHIAKLTLFPRVRKTGKADFGYISPFRHIIHPPAISAAQQCPPYRIHCP